MTIDEAEQLIAEIAKKYGAQYGTYLVPPAEQIYNEIIQIIKRFANAAPEDRLKVWAREVSGDGGWIGIKELARRLEPFLEQDDAE